MLRDLLSRDMKKLAGTAYYARGKAYFEDGLVSSVEENDGEITACVQGTYDYEVRFWEEDSKLCYECSCPVGQDTISASIAWQPAWLCWIKPFQDRKSVV